MIIKSNNCRYLCDLTYKKIPICLGVIESVPTYLLLYLPWGGMFGLIASGRLVQTNWEQAQATNQSQAYLLYITLQSEGSLSEDDTM